MPGETLWEAVCSMAGKDGDHLIQVSELLERAAAGPEIASTEIRQLLEQGMLEQTESEGVLRLSSAGRLSCAEVHGTNARLTAPPRPEPGKLL